jgi:hypothetical protein
MGSEYFSSSLRTERLCFYSLLSSRHCSVAVPLEWGGRSGKLTMSIWWQGQQWSVSTSTLLLQLPHKTSLQFHYVFNYRNTRQTPSYTLIIENCHELSTTFEVKTEVIISFINLICLNCIQIPPFRHLAMLHCDTVMPFLSLDENICKICKRRYSHFRELDSSVEIFIYLFIY